MTETRDGQVEIGSLQDFPSHFDTIADRIWRAWWEPYGEALPDVETALRAVMAAEQFPICLVATTEGRFVGTVIGIESDIYERPELGPCLAALWVEPQARGQGIAGRLIDSVLARLAALGFDEVYLSAKPPLAGFYRTRGWTLFESDVGEDHLDIYRRALS